MRPGNRPEGPLPTAVFAPLFSVFRSKRSATILLDGSPQAWPFRAFLMAGARVQIRFLLVAMMAGLLAAPCHADQPKAKVHRVAAPVAATPQPVAMPLRPDQMPASPPQVAFRNGELSINAQNSTLGDILRAVRNQTGANVEVPGNATERVVGNFGPGPARDVLSSLLNGSHFNYVLLGSATNPDALERVILTAKSSTAEPAASETASATPPPGPAENPEMTNEDSPEQAQEATDIFAEEPAQAEDPTQAPFGQPAANTRSPEQMLQDLQSQQQQIQQRQQQLGIPPGAPGLRGMPPGIPQPPQQPQ